MALRSELAENEESSMENGLSREVFKINLLSSSKLLLNVILLPQNILNDIDQQLIAFEQNSIKF